jgi:predicted acyltransferase
MADSVLDQAAWPRMVSIDVLRGVTVAFMILVNTAGDGSASYAQLRHSTWNGCTLTDLVFPTFLFLMGVSVAISQSPNGRTPAPAAARLAKATRRSVILICIGLFLNMLPFFNLWTMRYCGVMQRIGVTYWLAAVSLLLLDWTGVTILCALTLLGYWALMTLVPVPGFGKTGLELGVLNPVGNLASALDRIVIPPAHIYHHTFFDPEGLLSTLPALCSVLLGVVAWWFLQKRELRSRLALMAATGLIVAALGLAWNTVFPINKRLWTSSYVLWAAGIDLLILAVLSWYLDGSADSASRRLHRWFTPWLAFGSNALAAYVLSEVLASVIEGIHVAGGVTLQRWSYLQIPDWAGSPALRSLEWSLAFTAACYVPIHLLYRKRILIKL